MPLLFGKPILRLRVIGKIAVKLMTGDDRFMKCLKEGIVAETRQIKETEDGERLTVKRLTNTHLHH